MKQLTLMQSGKRTQSQDGADGESKTSFPTVIKRIVLTTEDCDYLAGVLQAVDSFGFDTESVGPALRIRNRKKMMIVSESKMVGFSVATDKEAYYVPMRHQIGTNAPLRLALGLLDIVSKHQGIVYAHNWKHDSEVLIREGSMGPPQRACDTMVLAWLLRYASAAQRGTYGLKYLSEVILKESLRSYADTVGDQSSLSDLSPKVVYQYACNDAIATYQLGQKFMRSIQGDRDLLRTFWELEMPMVWVLQRMERAGVGIDSEGFTKLAKELDVEILRIMTEWSKLCPIDIGAAGTLSRYLYDEAKLWDPKGIRRTARTDLAAIDDDAVEIQLVRLEPGSKGYKLAALRRDSQRLRKVRSTYSENFVQIGAQYRTGRVHAAFHHIGTETGRLSCNDPNLMQIPRIEGGDKYELGKRVRENLVARDGYVLVGADYSQIELRLLAHFAGEGALFDAYQQGLDIHQDTADRLKITRQQGKTVNFCIQYGGRSGKIATALGIPFPDAQRVYKAHLRAYPEIEKYRQGILSFVHQYGFVRTLAHRTRSFPELKGAKVPTEDCPERRRLWAQQREAANTPIQGSAADIVKKAMLDIDDCYRRENPNFQMICQIHDEIISEVPIEDAEKVKAMKIQLMESAWPGLRVPLIVEASIGKTWAEL